jgi:hypothetical protein
MAETSNCMMIEALMKGRIPRAKIPKAEIPPPEKTSSRPNTGLLAASAAKRARSIPGMGM